MMSKAIQNGLLLAGLMLAAAISIKISQYAHIFSSDTASRVLEVVIGLFLALYANFMPKSVPATRGPTNAGGRSQAVLRVGGWAFALAGLAFAAIWALAPLNLAQPFSTFVVVLAIVVTLGYAVWACTRHSPKELDSPAQ